MTLSKIERDVDKIEPLTGSYLLSVAAFFWSAVGLLLIARGLGYFQFPDNILTALAALFMGTLKSFFILDRVSRRNITRIRLLGGQSNILKIYSPGMWIVIGMMIVFGRILRNSSVQQELIGVLFLAIGWGLLFSSRKIWAAWYTTRKQ